MKANKGLTDWSLLILIFVGALLGWDIYNLLNKPKLFKAPVESIKLLGGEGEIRPHLNALAKSFRNGDTDYTCTVNMQIAEVIAENYTDISSETMNELLLYQKKCGQDLF